MVPLPVLVALALAGYRGTQLAVHDSILDGARDKLAAWAETKPSPLRTALAITLISCIYCIGWWISGALLATWLLATDTWHDAPLLVHGIEWLAVAGGQALLNRWDDTRPEPAA